MFHGNVEGKGNVVGWRSISTLGNVVSEEDVIAQGYMVNHGPGKCGKCGGSRQCTDYGKCDG